MHGSSSGKIIAAIIVAAAAVAGIGYVLYTNGVTTLGLPTAQAVDAVSNAQYKVDVVDNNRVVISNIGSAPLSNFNFIVDDNPVAFSGPDSIQPNTAGTFILDASNIPIDAPHNLRVIASGYVDNTKKLVFRQLLENGNFENNNATTYRYGTPAAGTPGGWGCSGSNFSLTTESHTGKYALFVSGPSGEWTACYQMNIPFIRGATYEFSGYYMCPEGSTALVFVGDDRIYGNNTASYAFSCDSAWQPMNLKVRMDSSATALSVYLFGNQNSTWAAYDDLHLAQIHEKTA